MSGKLLIAQCMLSSHCCRNKSKISYHSFTITQARSLQTKRSYLKDPYFLLINYHNISCNSRTTKWWIRVSEIKNVTALSHPTSISKALAYSIPGGCHLLVTCGWYSVTFVSVFMWELLFWPKTSESPYSLPHLVVARLLGEVLRYKAVRNWYQFQWDFMSTTTGQWESHGAPLLGISSWDHW